MFRILIAALLVGSFSLGGCTKKGRESENTLNVVVSSNIKGLDPVNISDTYSSLVASQMYEGLLHYNYLQRPLKLQPLLAAEMPKVSSDGLTHTFKIRPGMKFHDDQAFPESKGREVTAEDFIYSWKRLADPANQSEAFWVFDGKIVGLNEWRDKMGKKEADYSTPVAGLTAPDKNTLVIKLTKPYYQLHYVLAMSTTVVVPKEAVEKYGKEFLNHPVGTGPFKFESWTRNSQIVMVKNPNWATHTYPTEGTEEDKASGALADAGQKLPFVDKLVVHEIIEDQPRWLNFMKGNLDFVAIPKDNFDGAVQSNQMTEEMQKKGILLSITREPDVTYTAFNMLDPVVGKNENLRKAISLATDTDTLIQKFYNGRAVSAHSPIPPDVDGYDANYKNPYKEYNISKAKELLSKAGFPEGKGAPEIEYSTTSSSTARQMAEYFKQNMEAIGLKVKIDSTSWPQFTTKIREKKAQVWGIAWMADYPDAENFLQLLYGQNVSPGPNGSNYKSKEFDALYEKASKLPPGNERTKIYQQMRDIAARDLPWIPNAHRLGYITYHSWLKNFKYHSIINDYLKYLRVDTKARGEQKANL
ncbi:MAG: ABC transporter substrate-binding protein [Bdellovibrionales bacterium]